MSAAKMTCPVCIKKKVPADEHGHCSYACASGGSSAGSKKRSLLITTVLDDGRIQLSGPTFALRDQIKARGGRWLPLTERGARVWILPAGTDTTCFLPPPPVAAAPAPLYRARSGRCCAAATARMDDADPYGPLWYVCTAHGSFKSSYSGS
jgi:hypothetical protein